MFLEPGYTRLGKVEKLFFGGLGGKKVVDVESFCKGLLMGVHCSGRVWTKGAEEVIFSDPGLSIGGWLLSYGKPYSCVGDSRTGLEAHQVDFGPVLYEGAFWVVVLVPKETKVRVLVIWYRELVEHVFHICGNGI